METTIIITECKNPYGKYWEFKDKQSGQIVAEVDRKREFNGLYFLYTLRGGFLYESSRHRKKSTALEKAKESIREQFAGVDFKFKLNVMTKHFRWS